MRNFRAAAIAAIGAIILAGCASAPPPPPPERTLRVNVFPGSTNAPLLIGIERGIFAKYRLTIELQNTPNSDEQRAGLAAGKFDIAHAAVDNAVAMVERAGNDVIIVMGGDASMNEFMVRPEIRSFADIRGKVVAVDAPNTAYALVAKKILKNNGLIEGRDYTVRNAGGTMQRSQAIASNPELVAGMVFPPFSFTVREKGLKSLGRSLDLIGPYQATGAFVMRPWAAANAEVLERYIAAYIEATRFTMDPANRTFVVETLVKRFKLEPAIAEQTYTALMTPGVGLARDARFDMAGFNTVLGLRAEIEGQWGGKAPAPDKFVDLRYYDAALKKVGAQ